MCDLRDGNVYAMGFSGSQCPFHTILNGPCVRHTLRTAELAAVDFAEPGTRLQEVPCTCRKRQEEEEEIIAGKIGLGLGYQDSNREEGDVSEREGRRVSPGAPSTAQFRSS